MIRIGIIGSLLFSQEVVTNLLAANVDINFIIAQRNPILNSDYINLDKFCNDHSILQIKTDDINDPNTVSSISELQPDILICLGWSRRIQWETLSIPKFGVLGYHPSKLPNNRGRHPIIWALALGLKNTASSFFKMDENFDTGVIVSQKNVEILKDDYAFDLYKKLAITASGQLYEIISNLEVNKTLNYHEFNSKDQRLGNFWRKRDADDGKIDWRMHSGSIRNLVRALSFPYPYAHFVHRKNNYRIVKAACINRVEKYDYEPGKIIEISKKNSGLTVMCADNAISLKVHSKDIADMKLEVGDCLV